METETEKYHKETEAPGSLLVGDSSTSGNRGPAWNRLIPDPPIPHTHPLPTPEKTWGPGASF